MRKTVRWASGNGAEYTKARGKERGGIEHLRKNHHLYGMGF